MYVDLTPQVLGTVAKYNMALLTKLALPCGCIKCASFICGHPPDTPHHMIHSLAMIPTSNVYKQMYTLAQAVFQVHLGSGPAVYCRVQHVFAKQALHCRMVASTMHPPLLVGIPASPQMYTLAQAVHQVHLGSGVADCACTPAAGDLGAIDAKYDIAVSTSCAALDYIVVDNTATAQCCVELLRRQNLGVGTFLILDKQQHLAPALQNKPTPPEGASPSLTTGFVEALFAPPKTCLAAITAASGPFLRCRQANVLPVWLKSYRSVQTTVHRGSENITRLPGCQFVTHELHTSKQHVTCCIYIMQCHCGTCYPCVWPGHCAYTPLHIHRLYSTALVAGVPRLFDLIRVREERVKLAFYFALRDTVVAGTLDQASKIAYGADKRWGRVVTLKVCPVIMWVLVVC